VRLFVLPVRAVRLISSVFQLEILLNHLDLPVENLSCPVVERLEEQQAEQQAELQAEQNLY